MSLNTFRLQNEKGRLTLEPNLNVLSCTTNLGQDVTTLAGHPFLFGPSEVSNQIICAHATGRGQAIFGFQVFDTRKNGRIKDQEVRIAANGAVMYMEAGDAFNRGVDLEVDFTFAPENVRVVLAATSGQVIGKSLDIATAAGDIVRVFISGVLAHAPIVPA